MMYLAHISEDRSREQTLKDHLEETAKLAGDFASVFECKEWGEGCGLFHDVGKYSDSFQKRLHGGPITDHATAGAVELNEKAHNLIGAYCVSGHHSGLLDGGTVGDAGGEATLCGRLRKKVDAYQIYSEEISMPSFPAISLRPLGKGGFSMSFFIRMLFSCVVDADFLNTEEFMKGESRCIQYDSINILFERLQKYIAPWLNNADKETVNGRRTDILKACLEMGAEKQGLFQLTVPTGGGKTVSSLAFALRHAMEHHLDRIIYVIPFTSIIEQNAQVFKKILGRENVLEHHSNVVCESSEELQLWQLATENWDSPVVVTTNVQFFESLFANRTSQCRKLHNIANSVIIFDEAQMLPVPYLKPCLQAISELLYNYHSSAVICTATQPSLQTFFPAQLPIREICPDVKGQYEFFRRTTIQNVGELSEEELTRQLREFTQVLCILNSRKRVQRIYEIIKEPGTYHLSTFMYPNHRKEILREIKERLREGLPCRLVATSLVEAGVDFDFPMVYREMAGVDSVIQAAGRCNREGKKERDKCRTIVFTMEKSEDIHIPNELKLPIAVGNEIAGGYEDIASLEAISEYFRRLYYYKGESLDQKKIIDQFEQGARSCMYPFATVARSFHLIENKTKTILIDVEPEAEKIAERIRWGERSRQLMRDAGQYCVNIYEQDFQSLNGAGLLEQIEEKESLELYVLRDRGMYTWEKGLTINVSRGEAVIF